MNGRKWRSLGAAAHYDFHLRTQLEADPNFPLPEVHGITYDEPGRTALGSREYPTAELVRSLDKRSGGVDAEPERAQQVQAERRRLYAAIEVLREFDEIMMRLVVLVCLEGRVVMLPGGRTRHVGEKYEEAARLYFDEDTDRSETWLDLAWDFVALVLSPAPVIAEAAAKGAVWRKAYDWLGERGILQ